METDRSGGDLRTRDGARARVLGCVEDFLDDHKDAACRAAWLEPSRFYFDVIGDGTSRDHVNVHAINAYLCLLRGGLGVQLPMLPEDQDQWPHMGLADCWAGLHAAAFDEHFGLPQNFGKAFEGISSLKPQKTRTALVRNWHCGRDMGGGGDAGPLNCGRPVELEQRAASGTDPRLGIYLRRFAYFFRAEFLLRRMFEQLNSETKPEHVGFARAAETLFQCYKTEVGANGRLPEGIEAETTLVEHLYDEMFVELDLGRTASFFAWLGVVKPEVAARLQQVSSPAPAPAPSSEGSFTIRVRSDHGVALAALSGHGATGTPAESLAQELAVMLGVSNESAQNALVDSDGNPETAVAMLLSSSSELPSPPSAVADVDEGVDGGEPLRRTRSQEENAVAMAALARQLADMMNCEVGRAVAALEQTGGEPELAITILLDEQEDSGTM